MPLSIRQISRFPTTTNEAIEKNPSMVTNPMHESLFRSYQILQRVKWLIDCGASPAVIEQEVNEMEDAVP